MKKRFLVLVGIMIIFASCEATKQQASGIYNLVKCKYSFNSIARISIAGMNANNGLSLSNITKVSSILAGKAESIPLDFIINIDVNNPNTGAALLHGMDYVLSIDDIQFTSGSIDHSLNIGAGQTQVLPISIGLDLATLMKPNSKSAIVDITKNFLGMGSKASNISMQMKPTFKLGENKIAAPMYIPVNFSFGGKK